jgi:hypothetical protein
MCNAYACKNLGPRLEKTLSSLFKKHGPSKKYFFFQTQSIQSHHIAEDKEELGLWMPTVIIPQL